MPETENRLSISTGAGDVPALFLRPEGATALLVLAHGAGAGMEHPFMAGFAAGMYDAGVATLRFDFPYRAAGRSFPDRPPVAIDAWRAAMESARGLAAGLPVFSAGKSFGGRMASMAVAEGMETEGLVYLGYPLHAPGKPEKPRDAHLYGITAPMLFLQGSRDPFALPGELEPVVERIGATARLHWIEGGDHSFKVARSGRTPAEDGALAAVRAAEFIAATAR
ncbi:alpha/beta family hydrolase [Zafaria sp. Z1313]|uniref:alpha/beta hydrolase family protein n=1 Tax=unclassified Zafaria TaxID=2828765 RepID=UPI002E7A08D5|nr:alpha/beta family hydrolase [Zafaria sp. J156]MEE1621706.1 alpha/beta family hydrolase [Zafaria sp. J156]